MWKVKLRKEGEEGEQRELPLHLGGNKSKMPPWQCKIFALLNFEIYWRYIYNVRSSQGCNTKAWTV
jgi:hypothetical protein